MFTGSHISRVQYYGVQLLMARQRRERDEEALERVKLALVTYDPTTYLPTILNEAPSAYNPYDIEDDENLADTEGEWDFSQSDISPLEAAAILEGFQQETTITADLSDA